MPFRAELHSSALNGISNTSVLKVSTSIERNISDFQLDYFNKVSADQLMIHTKLWKIPLTLSFVIIVIVGCVV